MPVSVDDIRAAAQRIGDAIEHTPCLRSLTLSRLTGAELWLKFENLQFTASFKERGALNKLLRLPEASRRRGVIAMSAGNHAQGVAYHAARLGVRAVIVMPRGTPNAKISSTRVHGAEVIVEGDTLAQAARHARELEAREGLVFVHPYDDPDVIAGQGTLALEMLEQAPGLEMLVVPVGGGGLASGMTVAAKALWPGIEVLGVESRREGTTLAEGIAVKEIGALPSSILTSFSVPILQVEEESIERAIVALVEIEKTVAEGAGAAALAAVLQYPERFAGRRVGIPICGGNIDSRVLASVLMRGLVRDGRLLRLRVTLPDIAGSLARVATAIGEAGGNIVDVHHQRVFGVVSVKSPELEFVIETRDREHGTALLAALLAQGVRALLVA